MDAVISALGACFAFLMRPCYRLLGDYGLSIILFVLLSKLVQLPLSVWVHKNGIKMIRMQPELNRMKVRLWGDKDAQADEQQKLYKREGYNAFASLIPLLVQLLLLMGVVQVIYNPLSYIFRLPQDAIALLVGRASELAGFDAAQSAAQLMTVRAMQRPELAPAFAALPLADAQRALADIAAMRLVFCGVDLSLIPTQTGGALLLVPLLAGASAWLMVLTQNRSNVLQAEQGKWNQGSMMVLSVGLSLYLGLFVPAGIALYWICGNLLSIAQMYALNAAIPPSRSIDYQALEDSRRELQALQALGGGQRRDPNARRERADYKRFFSIVHKHIAFYSERGGFYKYYEALIDYLLANSDVVIHYITNDPRDPIFDMAKTQTRIKPYYIGVKRLITLMMKLEVDLWVTTTPDLDSFYLKRSRMRKDIEYIYVPHDSVSTHMAAREGAFDHFDTIFCVGPHAVQELRATERVYGLPPKRLIAFGYPLLEKLARDCAAMPARTGATRQIVIAPSWAEDNLLDSCIDVLLDRLCGAYRVVVRPHPEYMKRYAEKMERIVARHADKPADTLAFELDFATNASLYESDLLITDWSGVANEFCFATLRPALFVNTKQKIENPNYGRIDIVPQEVALRTKLGVAIDPARLDEVATVVEELLRDGERWRDSLRALRERYFFDFGGNGRAGGEYLLDRLCGAPMREADEA